MRKEASDEIYMEFSVCKIFSSQRGDEQIPRNPKQQKDENETAVPSLLLSYRLNTLWP